jgi:hypothetical protein
MKHILEQMRNLAADPAFAEHKTRLSAKLMDVLEKTNDPRLTDAFDRPTDVTDTPASAPSGKKRKAPQADLQAAPQAAP